MPTAGASQRGPRPSKVRRAVAVACLAMAAATARADDAGDGPPPPDDMHMTYSADDRWAGRMLAGTAALFALAAAGGGLVWRRARGLVPTAATHEEDPGADRH